MKSVQESDGLGDHAPVLQSGEVAAIEVVAPSDHDFDALCSARPVSSRPASARAAVAASRTRNCSGSPPKTVRGMIPCWAASKERGESRYPPRQSRDAIDGGRSRVAECLRVPAIGGDIPGGVLAGEDVLEVSAHVGSAREAASKADDGDFGGTSPGHEPISRGSAAASQRDRIFEGTELAGEDDLDIAFASMAQLIDRAARGHPTGEIIPRPRRPRWLSS